jgi:hypothetical protein
MQLAAFMRREGIRIVVVNSLHAKRSEEMDDNSPAKNGKEDEYVIA